MIRYAGAGGVSAIFHYGTLIFCVEVTRSDAVVSAIIASAVGAVVNYILNYHFTFSSQRAHRIGVTRFAIVAVLGTGLNAAIMHLGVNMMELHYLPTQGFATGVVFFWNFALNRAWTFGVQS